MHSNLSTFHFRLTEHAYVSSTHHMQLSSLNLYNSSCVICIFKGTILFKQQRVINELGPTAKQKNMRLSNKTDHIIF